MSHTIWKIEKNYKGNAMHPERAILREKIAFLMLCYLVCGVPAYADTSSPPPSGALDTPTNVQQLQLEVEGKQVINLTDSPSLAATVSAPLTVNGNETVTGYGSIGGNLGVGGTAAVGGYVGIGTTSPQSSLHIVTPTGQAAVVQVETPGASATDQSAINFVTKGDGQLLSGYPTVDANNSGWQIYAHGNDWSPASQQNDLGFSFWNGSTWTNQTLVMTPPTTNAPYGAVGIGTTAPQALLDVNGGAHVSENANVGGAVTVGSTVTVGSLADCAVGTPVLVGPNGLLMCIPPPPPPPPTTTTPPPTTTTTTTPPATTTTTSTTSSCTPSWVDTSVCSNLYNQNEPSTKKQQDGCGNTQTVNCTWTHVGTLWCTPGQSGPGTTCTDPNSCGVNSTGGYGAVDTNGCKFTWQGSGNATSQMTQVTEASNPDGPTLVWTYEYQ